MIQIYANNVVFTAKIRLCSYKITINYLLSDFLYDIYYSIQGHSLFCFFWFKNYERKIKSLFMIYTYFESILVLQNNWKQNPDESYSSLQYGGIRIFWVQKMRQEKLIEFIKIFELYQIFMYINILMLPYCILMKSIKSIFNTSQ